MSLVIIFALDLPKLSTRRAAALHLRHEQQQQDHQHRDRQQVDQQADEDVVLVTSALIVPVIRPAAFGLRRARSSISSADSCGNWVSILSVLVSLNLPSSSGRAGASAPCPGCTTFLMPGRC